jgi:DNA-binding transcriptional LysR family regulator
MVSTGMGVSIVPKMAIEKLARCCYVRIADDQATRIVGATILRGRSLTRLHHAFLAHLRSTNSAAASK